MDQCFLGQTESPNRKHGLGVSKKPCKWQLAQVSLQLSGQLPIRVGLAASAAFTRTINKIEGEPAKNYIQLLQDARNRSIILYDTVAKRGWLVPLRSVLHQMAIIYYNNDSELRCFRDRERSPGSTSPRTLSVRFPDCCASNSKSDIFAIRRGGMTLKERRMVDVVP